MVCKGCNLYVYLHFVLSDSLKCHSCHLAFPWPTWSVTWCHGTGLWQNQPPELPLLPAGAQQLHRCGRWAASEQQEESDQNKGKPSGQQEDKPPSEYHTIESGNYQLIYVTFNLFHLVIIRCIKSTTWKISGSSSRPLDVCNLKSKIVIWKKRKKIINIHTRTPNRCDIQF